VSGLERLPLREDLRGLTPYGAPQLDVPVRLNTNENPYPPPADVVAAIGRAASDAASSLNRYPDREAVALRSDLASYLGHGFTADSVWAANGSNEALQQLLQAFGGPGRRALGFEPSYSMHRLIALGTSTGWIAGRRDPDDFGLSVDSAVQAVRQHHPDVVFLCSPNNPTATALDADVVANVYDVAPGMVIVDEAYAEFSHRPSVLPLLDGRDRLVITRTMSKAFALAGARVGYLAADPAVVDALRLVRLPYHLSSLTQATAAAAVAHASVLLGTVEQVKLQRDRLVVSLRGLGLTVIDSDANFVLFGRFPDQRIVWQRLLDAGVLVRDVGLPGWLRVSAGREPEVDAFLLALKEIV
jgi:histidinol-phosphate aminotransferase